MKELSRAKSRLAVGEQRSRLALAFARDTLAAVTGSPRVGNVVVVTNDPFARQSLAIPKVRFCDDPGPGLNTAIANGLAYQQSAGSTRLAVIFADLPSATTESVTEVLHDAERHTFSFVADHEMSGTTAVFFCEPPGSRLWFGPNSRSTYLSAGATELVAAEGLSRDVDRVDHLRAAVRLGVGEHTSAALARHTSRELVNHGL